MKKLLYILLPFIFGFKSENKTPIVYRSFYAEMKALEKPERVTAFGYVQGAKAQNENTTSLSITLSATTVNNLVVVNLWVGSTTAISTVTDNGGNSYVEAQNFTINGNYRQAQYYAFQSSSATSVTVTIGLTAIEVFAEEFSGFTGTPTNAECFDVSGYGTGFNSGPLKSSAIAPINTSCLIVSGGVDDAANFTTGTGFSTGQVGIMFGGAYARTQYKLTSGASEVGEYTYSATSRWGSITTSFKQEDAVGLPKGKAIRSAGIIP